MRPVRPLRLRYCAAPGSRRFVLESVSARADGARRSRRGDWLGFRARSLCSRVSGFAAAPFRNSARERGERPPKSNGRPSLSGRRRAVPGGRARAFVLSAGGWRRLWLSQKSRTTTRGWVFARSPKVAEPTRNRAVIATGKCRSPLTFRSSGFDRTTISRRRGRCQPGCTTCLAPARAVLVALPPNGDSYVVRHGQERTKACRGRRSAHPLPPTTAIGAQLRVAPGLNCASVSTTMPARVSSARRAAPPLYR